MSVSIVVADEHPVVLKGLHATLEQEADFTIVAEASDGLEAARVVERLRPDVLILDLRLSGLSGLDVLPLVRRQSPHTRIVVFTAHATNESLQQALQQGAIAYVLKTSDLHHLVKAVRHAAKDQRYLGPGLAEPSIETDPSKAPSGLPDPHALLTPRERQVLHLVAEGNSASKIAKRLSISPRTAEMHRSNAMRKLGLRTQTDVIRYAIRRGMIPNGG